MELVRGLNQLVYKSKGHTWLVATVSASTAAIYHEVEFGDLWDPRVRQRDVGSWSSPPRGAWSSSHMGEVEPCGGGPHLVKQAVPRPDWALGTEPGRGGWAVAP